MGLCSSCPLANRVGIVVLILAYTAVTLVAAWIAGALYYDLAQARWYGWPVVAVWIAVVAALVVFCPGPVSLLLVMAGVLTLVLAWWLSIRPSQVREWDPDFSRPAEVSIEGDCLTIHNVRITEYPAPGQRQTGYETRRCQLSRLGRVDVLILYWGSPWMCHPMFVFDFAEAGRICISIEVRYRKGQVYDFLRSLYRQQELCYVVSDERDAILRRTKYQPGQDLYLYQVREDALKHRQFFFEYADRINRLAEEPRWYNGVTANCTTGIYAQARGRIKWNWRMLFNGTLDRLFYDRRLFDQTLPFDELKRLSRVNEIANRAPAEGFGDFLRDELPGYQPGRAPAPAIPPKPEAMKP